MKNIFRHSLCGISFFFLLLITQSALAFSGTGAGTSGDPYQITTCDQLLEINNELGADYILMNNLNCTSYGSGLMIGETNNAFSGNLDGGDYVISLHMNIPNGFDYAGLFTSTYYANIQSLTVSGTIISDGNNEYIGLLTAQDTGSVLSGITTYINHTSLGDIFKIGGLVGEGSQTSFTNIQSDGDMVLQGLGYAGGIVGWGNQLTINESSSSVSFTGSSGNIGGIGAYIPQSNITKSSYSGSIYGNSRIGGFVGETYGTSITESYAQVEIIGENDHLGGIIGFASSSNSVSDVYVKGSISGGATADRCGGILGIIAGSSNSIDDSFSTVTISCNSSVGGLGGEVYSLGGGVTVSNSFWDTEVSGVATTDGGGSGITTEQAQEINTFNGAGWDIQYLSPTSLSPYPDYPYLSREESNTDATWSIIAAPDLFAYFLSYSNDPTAAAISDLARRYRLGVTNSGAVVTDGVVRIDGDISIGEITVNAGTPAIDDFSDGSYILWSGQTISNSGVTYYDFIVNHGATGTYILTASVATLGGAETETGDNIHVISVPIFYTAPEDVSSTSYSVSSNSALLSRTNPTAIDFHSIMIRRKNGSFPSSPTDGTRIASGITSTSYTDGPLSDGVYFYTLFARDNDANRSTGATIGPVTIATAPPSGGRKSSTSSTNFFTSSKDQSGHNEDEDEDEDEENDNESTSEIENNNDETGPSYSSEENNEIIESFIERRLGHLSLEKQLEKLIQVQKTIQRLLLLPHRETYKIFLVIILDTIEQMIETKESLL